jgi:hypothetical protein
LLIADVCHGVQDTLHVGIGYAEMPGGISLYRWRTGTMRLRRLDLPPAPGDLAADLRRV